MAAGKPTGAGGIGKSVEQESLPSLGWQRPWGVEFCGMWRPWVTYVCFLENQLSLRAEGM